MKSFNEVTIYTDGASRGNPGPASIGIVFKNKNGEIIFEHGAEVGIQTNNFAEYTAVIKAFEIGHSKKTEIIHFCSDSQLLIRQMLGEYKVKSEVIIPLYKQCIEWSKKFKKVTWTHVPREQNKEADAMANKALDGLI